MPRLGQVGRDGAHPYAAAVYSLLFGDRDPVEQPGTDAGTPGNWWTVFALVPDAFDHTSAGFQFYRSPSRKLSPRLRELGQTRAGWTVGSQFVFSQHCKAMRDAGFTDEQVAAVPSWSVAECWTPAERAVLAVVLAGAIVTYGGVSLFVAYFVLAPMATALFRAADKSAGVFAPLAPPLLRIHRNLKAAFDPAGVFNPGRLVADL